MRRGSILILVAGLCAVMALMATAFLSAMRSEAAHNTRLVQETQNRVSLTGACLFILESAPKWGGGSTGPSGTVAQAMRGPHELAAWTRPPWAVATRRVYSPLMDGNNPVARPVDEQTYDYRPQAPIVDRQLTEAHESFRPAYPRKDPTTYLNPSNPQTALPRRVPETLGKAWFRCHHEGQGRFVVTVGAGGTLGHRNWSEASASGAFSSQAHFEEILATELRAWYRVTWSPYTKADLERLPEFGDYDNAADPEGVSVDWEGFEHASESDGSVAWGIPDHRTFSRPGDAWRMFGRIVRIQRLDHNLPSSAPAGVPTDW